MINFEAEKSILAIFIHSSEARASKIPYLKPTDFSNPVHRALFVNLNELFYQTNNQFDLDLFFTTLHNKDQVKKCGGKEYLVNLVKLYSSDLFLEQYFYLITQKAIHRDLQLLLDQQTNLLKQGNNPSKVLKSLYLKLNDLDHNYQRTTNAFVAVSKLLQTTFEHSQQQKHAEDDYFSTGFANLDEKLGGFRPGQLIILAGRPSMGKTALSLNLIFNDFFFNKNTSDADRGDIIFFSLEMSNQQLSQRIFKSYLDLSPHFLHDEAEIQRVEGLIANLRLSNIFIDTNNTTDIFQIQAKLRKWIQKRKLRLIVIDYLQLLKTVGQKKFENRNLEIAFWTRTLKEMALEFKIPIICLSQLSRNVEKRENKRPLLADLRDSGSIEQDADLVLFLYRDEYYLKDDLSNSGKTEYNHKRPQKAEIIIAKHRNGPIGSVEVLFIPYKTTFMDYSEN